MSFKEEKCLIAYFSRKGDNYVNGRIVNLSVGNTEVVAKMICEMMEGDLFSIDTVTQYPVDYTETSKIAQKKSVKMHGLHYPAIWTIWILIL